jgi:hypothetical protein
VQKSIKKIQKLSIARQVKIGDLTWSWSYADTQVERIIIYNLEISIAMRPCNPYLESTEVCSEPLDLVMWKVEFLVIVVRA